METTDAEPSRLRSMRDLKHIFSPTASHIYHPLHENQRSRRCTPWLFWVLVPFLMMLSVVTIITFSDLTTTGRYTLKDEWARKYRRSVSTTFHSVTFQEQVEYWDSGAAGDASWESLIPENQGLMFEKDEKGIARYSGFSMFHQLHCLSLLRDELIKAYGNKTASTPDEGHHHIRALHGGYTDLTKVHWYHCLDYLRQALICNADNTIEMCVGDASKPIATGWNRTHQCKSTKPMWDFFELHKKEFTEEEMKGLHDHHHGSP
ncbi:hypothetical protein AUEXF2481DRAFT_1553 [Aureobasidium subglaciale EXF-2481]|uniref:Uncharacterized protein n=1 Tax=Aureobasidium subglaciale (strain EXF-2481) TaxID=1043005 RepID=A0A074YLP0_AURSE|nr:uncharacterized protein AUEXF2481DRAFT_1553 [Aureobasidium subglaciale EXF-2481]KAI5203521.1 hypothetical protein E4T38_05106 [Aureobasidium subglaciale]KAI5222089.1 hypothetical protein E4T40_05144 [Aureobasidium subglaciale]KAI5225951.1 hypothetical protein E4T41_04963 [Aureobasidium subglaciale]KAI5261933.1 hypothetical protein E4T46_04856 [Aureobasidium subglaciale]KEQ98713.1 hypothetical protein AUEXF2481DRAFT_1553 [Aureobasidium subglaciale EXF-2481]